MTDSESKTDKTECLYFWHALIFFYYWIHLRGKICFSEKESDGESKTQYKMKFSKKLGQKIKYSDHLYSTSHLNN